MRQALQEKEKSRALDVLEEVETSHRVTPADVQLSEEAKITVGLAAREVAAQVGVPIQEIARALNGEMHWLESTGALMLVLRLDEADMFVEIPAEHWRFREKSRTPQ